jgi:spore coat protein A
VNVEPRRYRLRIVNGSQARFYDLKFASVGGNFQLPFWQIGAEGGLLRAPVQTTTLLIAPGERADVIVDFSGQKKTTQWVLKNDAKAPFPMGGGGGVSQLMLFNVNLPLNGTDTTTPPASLALPTLPTLLGPPADVTREQHLQEILDPATGIPIFLQLENARYLDEATGLPTVSTKPREHAVEDWLLVNTTADTHPIHLHLVHFEVADRRPFDPEEYLDAIAEGEPPEITYTGPAVPANPNENGLKDTVHANPGEVTRIRAKYDLPAGAVKPAQYVWHCHILEHEENDMMRAFEVV